MVRYHGSWTPLSIFIKLYESAWSLAINTLSARSGRLDV